MTLRARALGMLARREHGRAELARKLAGHAPADEVAELLDELERENLLSDVRFAEMLTHARAGRHGSVRLRAELREKGLPAEVIEAAVGEARGQDLDAARVVWLKKFGEPPRDGTERARQMRFLAGRGFPAEIVRKVVDNADD